MDSKPGVARGERAIRAAGPPDHVERPAEPRCPFCRFLAVDRVSRTCRHCQTVIPFGGTAYTPPKGTIR